MGSPVAVGAGASLCLGLRVRVRCGDSSSLWRLLLRGGGGPAGGGGFGRVLYLSDICVAADSAVASCHLGGWLGVGAGLGLQGVAGSCAPKELLRELACKGLPRVSLFCKGTKRLPRNFRIRATQAYRRRRLHL